MSITKTVGLDQFCKSIMNADRNVRSVSIIDKKGSVVYNISHTKIYAAKH